MSKTLGTIIAEERKKKGLSQEKFAEQMKCTRQMVSRWELDDAKPRTDNIKRICKILEIPIDELIGDKNNKKSNISNDSNPIKVEKFSFKKMSIIIGIIISLLIVLYVGYSIYKYTLLNNIYSKVAQYMNVENYYFRKDSYYNEVAKIDDFKLFDRLIVTIPKSLSCDQIIKIIDYFSKIVFTSKLVELSLLMIK